MSRIARFLERVARHTDLAGEVAHREEIPRREARFGAFPSKLRPELQAGLAALGIERPWVHQAEALRRALAGEDIVVVTPTASGKTLCYNLPVLDGCVARPEARALYLFPIKALEQDQLGAFRELAAACGLEGRVTAEIYDGDTSAHRRAKIRTAPPNVVISNPDMLHVGMLGLPPEVGDLLHEPEVRRPRRGPHLPRGLRLARRQPAAAAAARRGALRLPAADHRLLGDHRQPGGARGAAHRARAGGDRRQRRPRRRPHLLLPQPLAALARHARREAAARGGARGPRDDRLHQVAQEHRAGLHLGGARRREAAQGRQRLPLRLPPRGAARDRGEALLRRAQGGGQHLGARDGDRHRRAGRLHPRRLPRVDHDDLAARRARRAAGPRVARDPARRPGRARPVLHEAPAGLLRVGVRAGGDQPGEPAGARGAPGVRGRRAAAAQGRRVVPVPCPPTLALPATGRESGTRQPWRTPSPCSSAPAISCAPSARTPGTACSARRSAT